MKELLEFFQEINEVKHTERQGWKNIGVERPRDTIASHSLGAALLGWSLAERQEVNQEKTVKMLLMHDLIMSYIPDYTPEDEEFKSKREEEERKFKELIQNVPESISDEFREIFREFQAGESEAAKLARESDKLDTLLQALAYSRETGEDHLSEFLESYEDYFKTETGKEIFRQLSDRNY